jgi:hypothetical protein
LPKNRWIAVCYYSYFDIDLSQDCWRFALVYESKLYFQNFATSWILANFILKLFPQEHIGALDYWDMLSRSPGRIGGYTGGIVGSN